MRKKKKGRHEEKRQARARRNARRGGVAGRRGANA